MKYIFFGDNATIVDRLSGMLQIKIPRCSNYLQINNLLSQVKRPKNTGRDYCVFFERREQVMDISMIDQLQTAYPDLFIILISKPLKKEGKIPYLKAGISCMVSEEISMDELNRILHVASTLTTKPKLTQATNEQTLVMFKLPLWKRLFDIASVSVAILLLSPVFLITALLIRLESKGPVVYKAKRVGSNYKIFDFYKFRSMYADADRRLAEYKKQNQYTALEEEASLPSLKVTQEKTYEDSDVVLFSDNLSTSENDYLKVKRSERSNAFFKLKNDPRITHVGHIIRKYSIDELPQLFNILKGDMSVVGNRPLPLYEAELLTSDEYIQRFMAPAGLTGLWQVEKRGGAGKMSAEERKQLDIKYARAFSFWMDIRIIFRTFTAFIQKEDV